MDEECSAWLSDYKPAPIKTVARLQELYQQLLPTKLYASRKTKTRRDGDEKCRVCRKSRESVTHQVSGCSAPVQTLYLALYLARHHAALKFLFFEMLRGIS